MMPCITELGVCLYFYACVNVVDFFIGDTQLLGTFRFNFPLDRRVAWEFKLVMFFQTNLSQWVVMGIKSFLSPHINCLKLPGEDNIQKEKEFFFFFEAQEVKQPTHQNVLFLKYLNH